MSYQLSNAIQSIHISNGSKSFYLKKKAVKEISIIKGNVIRISTGDCMNSIFLHHGSVSNPVTGSPIMLVEILNDWMNDFSIPPPPDK